jgi:hypothetical protein
MEPQFIRSVTKAHSESLQSRRLAGIAHPRAHTTYSKLYSESGCCSPPTERETFIGSLKAGFVTERSELGSCRAFRVQLLARAKAEKG